MNKYLENGKDIIIKNKKKIRKKITILIASMVVLCGVGASGIYLIAKHNTNYTVDQAKEIALQSVQGEIVKSRKTIELDNLSFEYKFKIKDSSNMLFDVSVDSNLGVITDIENYYD